MTAEIQNATEVNVRENLQRLYRELGEMICNYRNLPNLFPETVTIKINFSTMSIETEYK